jgi:drug/metabolite transporter (DMT)-like permease
MLKIIGISLVVIGILALVVPSISFTKTEKVVDLGPIQATAQKRETLPLSPILGVSALVVGAALLVVGVTRKS